MSVQPGNRVPEAELRVMTPDGVKPISTTEYFSGRKVVLFSVPGAFTPTCSARHLPGYVDNADAILAKGVDAIACLAVNDAHVMHAWGKSANADQIDMLADGNGDFARLLGLEQDSRPWGMGYRSKRFSMVVDDGVITDLLVEQPGEFRVSSAEHILTIL